MPSPLLTTRNQDSQIAKALKMSCSPGPVMVLLLLFGGSNGESVTQTQGQVALLEGASLTVNCSYETKGYPTLFWYVQYPGEGLQLLIKVAKANEMGGHKGFEAMSDEENTSFHLKKATVLVSDSAVYYCALRDTVAETTGGAEHKLSCSRSLASKFLFCNSTRCYTVPNWIYSSPPKFCFTILQRTPHPHLHCQHSPDLLQKASSPKLGGLAPQSNSRKPSVATPKAAYRHPLRHCCLLQPAVPSSTGPPRTGTPYDIECDSSNAEDAIHHQTGPANTQILTLKPANTILYATTQALWFSTLPATDLLSNLTGSTLWGWQFSVGSQNPQTQAPTQKGGITSKATQN
ncbi:PREDICTED: uncharacterized protein LOC106000422 [Dipodomys ordii]|uniref:Uncharacterized protein LOC106000422 n=1 Tax=Dipodomys ordii TaxID=10020 RepID=A0A1S3GQI1_DIPOR|nr:PREDICTED: uncharacterized protein LOC106000422 [Dipodomys ordii]